MAEDRLKTQSFSRHQYGTLIRTWAFKYSDSTSNTLSVLRSLLLRQILRTQTTQQNFEPWRDKDKVLEKEKAKRDAEELGDAMKSLENRTQDSKQEMDIMAALDEMKSMKVNFMHLRRHTGWILPQENDPTLIGRVKKSDAREMQCLNQHYYNKYIQALQNAADKADQAQLTKAYQTANVLFEVLKAVNLTQAIEVDRKIQETHNKVAKKTEIYVPYNILPLDPDNANQPIMRFAEIQAAVLGLRNTTGLPWAKGYKKKQDEDILDWLQSMFAFQKDNVANEREHLILLLANVHIRQFPKPDQQPNVLVRCD